MGCMRAQSELASTVPSFQIINSKFIVHDGDTAGESKTGHWCAGPINDEVCTLELDNKIGQRDMVPSVRLIRQNGRVRLVMSLPLFVRDFGPIAQRILFQRLQALDTPDLSSDRRAALQTFLAGAEKMLLNKL